MTWWWQRGGHTEARAALWARQRARLLAMWNHVVPKNPFWNERLGRFDVRSIRQPEDFQRLPFCSKEELVRDQQTHPPYGRNLTYPLSCYTRLHETSGTTQGFPLRWLDTAESWDRFVACWGTIFRFAGIRREDRLLVPFSFGPFIAFWGAFEAAQRMGLFCLPTGGLRSSARVRLLFEHGITVVTTTPTYALHLAEIARREGYSLADSPVRVLIVAGEPGGSVPAVRARLESLWNARVYDHWGMTEVGALGFECPQQPFTMHLLEEECVAEVLDLHSGQPVRPGEEGELVITTLWRWGSPVIRYRTGDMVRLSDRPCPCGGPWLVFQGGILGRRDDMLFIRGNNVYPSAFEGLVREFPEIQEFQVVIDEGQALPEVTLAIELNPAVAGAAGTDVVQRLEGLVHDRLHVRVQIQVVPPGTLPRFELKSRRWIYRRPG